MRSLNDANAARAFVRRLPDSIYITNERGQILDANPAFLELFGIGSVRELRQFGAADLLVDPEQRVREMEQLERHGEVKEFELQLRLPSGEVRTVLDTCYGQRDPRTGEKLYHGILIDITARKRLEERLVAQSQRDPLTGCYNRRYLEELARSLGRRRRPWGCTVIDIDHFKEYNDRLGHKAGDEVLVRLSRFLIRQTRADDAVIRMGGDEFLVVLPGADAAVTEAAADRLKAAAADQAPVPFSLGWASRRGRETLERTIHRADTGLLSVRVSERGFVRRLRDRQSRH